ncbi:MAG: selenocysteine-specific translation elongation factor [Halioglobus sp.]|nr:selenocysteine-specific translation elongation factor [Halioglobus sp.]
MIIATAGHVDHGKTSLIARLTGVDTDRTAEEKRRGLSINLGFAYLPREDGLPLGFIDVPGHHRFINNMICGVSGIDRGLLLVAADDGPMPQTIEHLDVLRLLGVPELTVALSKIDRASEAQREAVAGSIRDLCRERDWANSPVFPLSNVTGEGVDALQTHLLNLPDGTRGDHQQHCFRLAVDRAFHLKGSGLVVTGTVSAGSVSTGDTLRLEPGRRDVRVRTLRVHDGAAEHAIAGQRCALNLTGEVALENVNRGDWLVGSEAAPASSRIDVSCTLLPHAPFPLKHMAPVKLHVGARRMAARLALIDASRIAPGEEQLAQLLTAEPAACARDEHFLLRDDSGSVLLGGGVVVDPLGEMPRRPRLRHSERIKAMQAHTVADALAARIALDEPVDLERFAGSCNLTTTVSATLQSDLAREYTQDGKRWLVSESRWRSVREALQNGVAAYHRARPQEPGMKVSELTAPLRGASPEHLLMAVLGEMIGSGRFTLKEGRVALADFKQRVSTQDEQAWYAIKQVLNARGEHIPLFSELTDATGLDQAMLKAVIRDKLKAAQLHRVSERRNALPEHLLKLAQGILRVAERGEAITVITVKNEWSAGRNLTVEVLEYFDSIRFTQRRENERVVLDANLPQRLYSG